MAVRLEYNDAEVHQLLDAPSGPTGQYLAGQTVRVRARAQQLADSRLKRSVNGVGGVHYHDSFINYVAASPLRGIVGNTAPHAQWPSGGGIETGTRPHPIRARRAPMLVFYWPKVGRVVRFKAVNHPGTKSYHILTDSLRAIAEP